MASELQLQTSPTQADLTVYALIRNASGLVWQTTSSTFVTYTDANLANYDVALTEEGTSSGYYVGDFPTAITTAGTYTATIWKQAGGAPATTDTMMGVIDALVWTGSAVDDGATGDDLITLTYYKEYHNVTSTNATRDTALARLITSSSKAIINACRKGIKLTSYTDYYDLDHAQYVLSLRNIPVTGLSSVTLYPYDTNAQTVDGGEYIISRLGEIALKPTSTSDCIFPCGFQTVKVVYSAGYSSVPADLQGATAELVKFAFDRGTRDQTVYSETLGDWSYTNATAVLAASQSWPATVREVLSKYKRSFV